MPQVFLTSQNVDNSTDRMRRLMETAKQHSSTAARIINYAFAYGCGFNFQSVDKAYGAYDKTRNMVYLNPNYSDAELLSTLVHESRHALQPKSFESAKYDIRTNLQWVRATEADAMAHECAAAHEMKKDLPQVWNQFKQKHAGIAAAYESFADQPDKALGEAFKVWHDNQKYVSKYDQNTLDQLAFDAGRSGFDFLKNSIPGEEIGEQICKKDGKSYLEKGFMTSARALIVDERTVWPKVIRVKQAAIEATNHRDSSDEELYTRAPDGTVVSRRTDKSSEKQQSVDNAAGKKCAGLSGSPSDIKNRLTAIKRRTSGR